MSKNPEVYRGASQFTSKVAKIEGENVVHSRRADKHSKKGHQEKAVFLSSDAKPSDAKKGLIPGMTKPELTKHRHVQEGLVFHEDLKKTEE